MRPEFLRSELIDAALTSVRAVGTPLWLYEAESIRERVRQLSMFECVRFAQKANSNTHILRLLRSMGVAVDAVSFGEIERALRAGYVPGTDAHEIVFTADIIDEETLARVVALKIPVNCGSPDMIRQIGRAGRGHPVWLRINPGFGHGHNRKTNTGGPSSKHGIWHEEFEDSLRLVDEYGLTLIGLHMHIGSGVDYRHLHRVCHSMLDAVRRANRPLKAISAGGGLSLPYRQGEPEIDIAEYYDAWNRTRLEAEKITGGPLRLELEPGRYLVGNAGVLVAEVRAVKTVADKHFVLIDAGFNDLARPILYGSHHDIVFVTPEGAPVAGPLSPIAVAGPLCEAGDVFTQQDGGFVEFRELALPKVGDFAILRDTGAYGATMSSNYNSRPLAPEVMLDAGKLTLIRKRQSIEQLLALEADPGPL
ncbi:diaminopimelate decarboxylase [Rhizobium sp. BK529]|uniref:diaminopimelate decarboxylase n=1 Tax=unclassified Rhizobium TaxID=2613769 RepID=UPI0010477B4C|nr:MULTISPECIES: diaminopimelate decarboxylase [unclassified Rhizobium]MBB3590843.1 diaminopimelate decarboxylase [Rhizobium sp. BK529]TCS09202.1 diaminopimelate decarboxylase [Rhizobium sp. BK418]